MLQFLEDEDTPPLYLKHFHSFQQVIPKIQKSQKYKMSKSGGFILMSFRCFFILIMNSIKETVCNILRINKFLYHYNVSQNSENSFE